jgi:CP family cyanate transporter-like MFS transporter
VVLVTLNLRPFLTAIGPLGPQIQSATGMDLSTLSWLTLLPMALMGVGAWLAPAALRRLGPRRAVVGSLAVIAAGCALRVAGSDAATLLATAALCGAGVALIQGVLPGLIKRQSPARMAQMMGLYSAALMGGGALGAQISPLAEQWGLDWRAALALWTLPALLALALARHALRMLPGPAPMATGASQEDTGWLRRRPRTWLLMACFGLINGGYAAMVAWLAPFYQTHGWSPAQSGGLVALLSVAQASAALGLPVLASRHADRRPWLAFTLLCQVIGLATLAWWPDAAPLLNIVILGIGLGGCFALMMVVALDHLPHPTQAPAGWPSWAPCWWSACWCPAWRRSATPRPCGHPATDALQCAAAWKPADQRMKAQTHQARPSATRPPPIQPMFSMPACMLTWLPSSAPPPMPMLKMPENMDMPTSVASAASLSTWDCMASAKQIMAMPQTELIT